MTKDVMDAIRERRSVRQFQPDPIPEPTLGRILEAAQWAPSAGNLQPFRFHVVYSNDLKEGLKVASYNQAFIAQAPVVVVVTVLPGQSGNRYGERGTDLYCLQDSAAAIQNLMLAATGFGIGSCWVGAYNDEAVTKVLELSDEERPVAIIPLGYPVNKVEAPPRYQLEKVVKIYN